MVKFCKSLSKTLIITVALATFLSTAVQLQSVQAAPSKASKGKSGRIIVQPTLTADQKAAAAVDSKILALPKVDKITLTNATSVNEAYAAFTALSKSQKALLTPSNSGKITAAINKIASLKGTTLKALSELNSGKKSFSNFVKAGVTGAVEKNNTLYFAEIAKAKLAKGSALTLTELQVIVDTVNKNSSSTTGLAVINAGTEVFADFTTAGITGAQEVNKAAYDTAIAKAKATKGSALTLVEVQAIVGTVNQAVVDLQASQVVINQIVALDNTKETYVADVAAAKEAYEMLTDAQKALVTNYDLLVNAI
jgi:hypothetical protein